MCSPSTPPPPEPIDPGESALRYLEGVSDPELQKKLVGAEREFRPQYAELNLQDIATYLGGIDGQPGMLDLHKQAALGAEDTRAMTASAQRESDIADVERLGARASEALRNSDPDRANLLDQQVAMTGDLYERSQGLTPQQRRSAEQQAREAFAARGRGLDTASVAAEILNREEFQRANRDEFRNASGQTFSMLQGTTGDPLQAILGRPSGAMNYGAQYALGGQNMLGQSTPQLFNPDAGINMALQEQGNMANYSAAKSAASGAAKGGLFSGIGSIIGGIF